ncbi:hypothetical protein VTJ83DRAFT_5798 [Remersonia thermophila]|uniref:Uncharacterized protein n=1 Tax=Remersonia thermophila TaxID=72144 RepID=A0ABR4D7Z8_9PEZI
MPPPNPFHHPARTLLQSPGRARPGRLGPSSHYRRPQNIGLSAARRAYSTTPPVPPTSASASTTTQSTRLDRLLSRLPPFLQRYASRLRGAPATHVAAFLLLHELTAVVPLFGLFGALHYWFGGGGSGTGAEGERNLVSWMLEHCGGYVSDGAARFERWFKRKGWFGFGEEAGAEREGERGAGKADAAGGDGAEGVLQRWERDAKYRVVVEMGLAYAITKVLLPVRIVASLWATPWFAGVLVRLGRVVGRRW